MNSFPSLLDAKDEEDYRVVFKAECKDGKARVKKIIFSQPKEEIIEEIKGEGG